MSDQIQSETTETTETIEAPTPIESANYVARPYDRNCRYWCKVSRGNRHRPGE